MLEHADGDDPVEGAGLAAVVAQVKVDALAEPGLGRPFLGHLVLTSSDSPSQTAVIPDRLRLHPRIR
jgi:hypothetical protein